MHVIVLEGVNVKLNNIVIVDVGVFVSVYDDVSVDV